MSEDKTIETKSIEVIKSLVKIRETQGLTQTDIAQKMGVEQSHVSRFETGKAHPRLSNVIKYAESIGAELTVRESVDSDVFLLSDKLNLTLIVDIQEEYETEVLGILGEVLGNRKISIKTIKNKVQSYFDMSGITNNGFRVEAKGEITRAASYLLKSRLQELLDKDVLERPAVENKEKTNVEYCLRNNSLIIRAIQYGDLVKFIKNMAVGQQIVPLPIANDPNGIEYAIEFKKIEKIDWENQEVFYKESGVKGNVFNKHESIPFTHILVEKMKFLSQIMTPKRS